MSKAQLKRHLTKLTKEQVIDVVLDTACLKHRENVVGVSQILYMISTIDINRKGLKK